MAISSSATGLRPGVVTSTTRPTAPYTGQIIYETDTGYLRVWDGSAWDYLSQKQDYSQGLGTGKILQVVNALGATTDTDNSTTTFQDTNLSASITPSSSSNNILVMTSQECFKSNGNLANGTLLRLMRGSTELNRHPYIGFSGTAIEMYAHQGFLWLDSPATTSSVTYKTQFCNNNGSAFVRINGASSPVVRGSITLMEIAA